MLPVSRKSKQLAGMRCKHKGDCVTNIRGLNISYNMLMGKAKAVIYLVNAIYMNQNIQDIPESETSTFLYFPKNR